MGRADSETVDYQQRGYVVSAEGSRPVTFGLAVRRSGPRRTGVVARPLMVCFTHGQNGQAGVAVVRRPKETFRVLARRDVAVGISTDRTKRPALSIV